MCAIFHRFQRRRLIVWFSETPIRIDRWSPSFQLLNLKQFRSPNDDGRSKTESVCIRLDCAREYPGAMSSKESNAQGAAV